MAKFRKKISRKIRQVRDDPLGAIVVALQNLITNPTTTLLIIIAAFTVYTQTTKPENNWIRIIATKLQSDQTFKPIGDWIITNINSTIAYTLYLPVIFHPRFNFLVFGFATINNFYISQKASYTEHFLIAVFLYLLLTVRNKYARAIILLLLAVLVYHGTLLSNVTGKLTTTQQQFDQTVAAKQREAYNAGLLKNDATTTTTKSPAKSG